MGAAGEEEPKHLLGPCNGEEKICVSVRLRPLNSKETSRYDVVDWECINDTTIVYKNNLSVSERSMYPSAYTFDRVFRSDCPTRQVYEQAAKEVAFSVVSASVFAYGQTSSGKTYTMSGITEYAVADIFDYTQKHKEREYILKFSGMEIYNESVKDLLSADSSPRRLLDDPERGTVVERLTEETLRDWNHFKELLSVCQAQRQIGETALNEASSRSHQILRLAIESCAREFSGNDNKSSILAATVNFVDLAGSERASQSLSAGARLKEGCHINRSLLTLGTVVRKLSKGKSGHVPYRDSKLTRILQSSLGGNARTAIICTMSPARTHTEQSRNTLLFASCAKEVTTNAQVNVVMSDKALVKHLQRELSRMESEMKNPRLTSTESDESSELLRQKDFEIATLKKEAAELKKEVAELTTERDLAQSQVEDLLKVVRVRPSPEVLDVQYPKLRVRSSWDLENSVAEAPVMVSLQYPYGAIRVSKTSETSEDLSTCSSNENLPESPDFRAQLLCTSSNFSPDLPVRVSDAKSYTDQEEETDEQIDETFEDDYKVVECIDIETQSNVSKPSPIRLSSSVSSPKISISPKMSRSTSRASEEEINEEDVLNQQFKSTPMKTPAGSDFVIPSREISSPSLLGENLNLSTVKLIRSRSCKASLTISQKTCSSPQWLDKKVDNEYTPAFEYERDFFSGRPEGIQRKFIAIKFDVDKRSLSRNASHASSRDARIEGPEEKIVDISNDETPEENSVDISNDETPEENSVDISNDKVSTDVNVLDFDNGEKTDFQDEEQLTDDPKDTEPKPEAVAKSVRSVGLDPIEDTNMEKSVDCQREFERVRREIVELWHTCNVSLVHRTYFFLLFKGDQKDSVHMEVEHKRLLYLKDAFLQGDQISEIEQTVNPAASTKTLEHERHMLSHLMKQRFSKEERENLFLRWGIGLSKKNRRLKLVQRLWTNATDLDHITESAAVVAKLVGFVEPNKSSKDFLGLNSLQPQRKTKKFGRWIRSVMSVKLPGNPSN
ncbi:hypothetical protein ACFE04_021876 [Oxalis oulophora]